MAAQSKAWVWGRSLAGIASSNPAGGHGCLSLMSVVCCQVEVSATGRLLVQTSRTECGVSECDRRTSTVRRSRPTGTFEPWKKNMVVEALYFSSFSSECEFRNLLYSPLAFLPLYCVRAIVSDLSNIVHFWFGGELAHQLQSAHRLRVKWKSTGNSRKPLEVHALNIRRIYYYAVLKLSFSISWTDCESKSWEFS